MEERIYGGRQVPESMADVAPMEGFAPLRPSLRDRDLTPKMAGGILSSGGPSRMTARTLIQDRIQKLRREADGLESLLRSIPEQMPPEADEALWAAMCKP